jgi:hypothetical protein
MSATDCSTHTRASPSCCAYAWIRAVSASLLPFHGCRSGTGSDRASAEAPSSSKAVASLADARLHESGGACTTMAAPARSQRLLTDRPFVIGARLGVPRACLERRVLAGALSSWSADRNRTAWRPPESRSAAHRRRRLPRRIVGVPPPPYVASSPRGNGETSKDGHVGERAGHVALLNRARAVGSSRSRRCRRRAGCRRSACRRASPPGHAARSGHRLRSALRPRRRRTPRCAARRCPHDP